MIHNMIGGAGGGINIKVLGGTSQPSGSENTIWVNIDTAINGYAFSATEPENPAEGMLWFPSGKSSEAAFNADKKNIVMIYPAGCKQYISEAWVNKDAVIYTNGQWLPIVSGLRIIADGVYDDSITGGWIAGNKKFTSASGTYDPIALTAAVETTDSSLVFTLEGNNYKLFNGSVLSANDIDFTELKQITFKGAVSGVQGQGLALSVMDRSKSYTQTDAIARVMAVEINDVDTKSFAVTLDVESIIGTYALAIGLQVQNYNKLTVNVTDFILE